MQDHLVAGGLLVAATHGPLGLTDCGELRLGAPAGGAEPGSPPIAAVGP